ncbi:hypothetical protein [Pradoshia sp.]
MYYQTYYYPMSIEQESRQQAPNPAFFPGFPSPPPPQGGINSRLDQLERQINRLNRRVSRIENVLGIREDY